MDPNATLEELRSIVTVTQAAVDQDVEINGGEAVDTLISTVELIAALDEWLSRGGFLPEPWQHTDDSELDRLHAAGWAVADDGDPYRPNDEDA